MLPAKNRHPAPSFVNPPSGQLLEFTSKEIDSRNGNWQTQTSYRSGCEWLC